MTQERVSIFWFRRDLRLDDNAGLYHALKENQQVLPIFIFDTEILNQLEDKSDRRVDFIHQAIQSLQNQLVQLGTSLKVFYCQPNEAFESLIKNYPLTKVYTNHDYEPYAIARDEAIKTVLNANNVELITFKDQCVFEKNEVLKDDGKPYTVFTPYSRKWKFHLKPFYYKAYPTTKYVHHFLKTEAFKAPGLKEMGFNKTDIAFTAPSSPDNLLLEKYKEQRDYPAIAGTSRLSMHLRFGTISIRSLVSKSLTISETWLNELIWRDFYMMILWHFPHAAQEAFKKDYNQIVWRNNESEFEKWCKGQTGFPIVDAGMRELNSTGFMHNRVRMIVSSFLVKDLLIDWRWGEAYFAQKLNDFDLSANNGGWQWAAGTGCDAAPYFRVFNPSEQQKKFDPEFKYIKKWVPEFGTPNYPLPMVDHAMARNRALATYKKGLQKQTQTELGLF
jgi:deoxyribodipyrimidine photo-lyase